MKRVKLSLNLDQDVVVGVGHRSTYAKEEKKRQTHKASLDPSLPFHSIFTTTEVRLPVERNHDLKGA